MATNITYNNVADCVVTQWTVIIKRMEKRKKKNSATKTSMNLR